MRLGRVHRRTALMAAALATLAAAALPWLRPAVSSPAAFEPAERLRILAHGPWPVAAARDPSNRVSGQPEAVRFGEALFHSTRLSRVPGLRCASCHEPWRQFSDGRTTGLGAQAGERNTPGLLNVALQRWFGWDGANDTLWAQSIRPLLDAREMGADPAFVAAAVRTDARLKAMYARSFGSEPGSDDEAVMVDAAKALAAYQETLFSARAPFDTWRDALARADAPGVAAYPEAARRGLRLFVGEGRCAACHSGPAFSDGRFHRVTLAHASGGHAAALQRLLASPYRLGGRFNDGAPPRPPDAAEADAAGAYRTPGLREVAVTAPYMHDGSVASLCEALLPHAALPAGQGTPPALAPAQRADIVAFLLTLGSHSGPPLVDPATLGCR